MIHRRLLSLVLVTVAAACASPIPNRDPAGEPFPPVTGRSPAGEAIELPAAYAGEPTVLVVGYARRAQFDVDRWQIGLFQAGVDAPLLQVSVSSSLVPSERSGWLDDDARRALVAEPRRAVLAPDADAARPLLELTGSESSQRARVFVLDTDGTVAWFDDEGYSVRGALGAATRVRELRGEPAAPATAVSRAGSGGAPTGELFPTVTGLSLASAEVELPTALAGSPAVLLVGYEQTAQLDIDRWLMGLVSANVTARIVEVPTIPSAFASLASGFIDDGMRAGIPRQDWDSVVTLYGGEARPVAELTGRENGALARVLVLDDEGRVAWFDDEGYAEGKPTAVATVVDELAGS